MALVGLGRAGHFHLQTPGRGCLLCLVGLKFFIIWEFPKIRGTLFGVRIIRILLFRVQYLDPLLSETPI